MLPEKYTQAVMMGEAVAGSIVAINRIITKAASGPERTGTLIFFSISLLFIIACVGLQFMLWKSPFVKYYMKQNTSKESKKSEIKSIKNCPCLKNRTSDGYNMELTSREEQDEESEEEIEETTETTLSYKLKKVKKLFISKSFISEYNKVIVPSFLQMVWCLGTEYSRKYGSHSSVCF